STSQPGPYSGTSRIISSCTVPMYRTNNLPSFAFPKKLLQLSSLLRKEAPKSSPFSNHLFTDSLQTGSFEASKDKDTVFFSAHKVKSLLAFFQVAFKISMVPSRTSVRKPNCSLNSSI